MRRRDEFDRQGKTVDLPADLADEPGLGRIEGGGRVIAGVPVAEELDRREGEWVVRIGEGRRQRQEVWNGLAGQPERFAARREDARGGRAAEDGLGRERDGVDDVLAIVEDEENVVSASTLTTCGIGLAVPTGTPRAEATALGTRLGSSSVVRSTKDGDGPAGPPIRCMTAAASVLADAARADHRHQPMTRQAPEQDLDIGGPADQVRRLGWQGRRAGRPAHDRLGRRAGCDRRREAVAATRYARHVLGPVRVLGERPSGAARSGSGGLLLDLRPGPGRRRQLAVADHLAGP